MRLLSLLVAGAAAVAAQSAETPALLPIETQVGHGYATNNSVRIHFASLVQRDLTLVTIPDADLRAARCGGPRFTHHEVLALPVKESAQSEQLAQPT
jgi:hypothetical protein